MTTAQEQPPPADPTRKPRTGRLWRFLQFPLTRLLLGLLAVGGADVAIQLPASMLPRPISDAVRYGVALAVILAVLGAYVGYVRLIERRRVVELGRTDLARKLISGFSIGAALFCGTVLILSLFGVCAIEAGEGFRVVPLGFAAALVAGVSEELMVRAVIFRIVEESLGTWIALLISAALFGMLHAFNDGATLTSTLAIAGEAGVLLAAAYVYSRGLWMPIAMHTAWNFTEGGVFGASVSGSKPHGLFSSHFAGPTLLTGGAFGPEASLVAVVLCFAVGMVLLWKARQQGQIVTPYWRRRQRV